MAGLRRRVGGSIFVGVGGASVTAVNPADTGTCVLSVARSVKAIIPGYVYPGAAGSAGRLVWDAWTGAGNPIQAIIANPGSPGGPGTFTDTNYAAVIAQAQAAGITILGYVDSNYARPDVSTPVLDTFNAGASQALTARAGWSSLLPASTVSIVTDATPTKAIRGASLSYAYWAPTYTDCEVRVKLAAISGTSTDIVRVFTRADPAANTSYFLDATMAGNFKIYRQTAGSSQILNVAGPAALAVGDEVCLRSIGTRHEAWYKPAAGTWTLVGSTTDSVITSGLIGLELALTTIQIDEFGGGAVATTPMAQIDAWKTLYGINDIFFDQASSGPGDLPYHSLLSNYVRSTHAGAFVMMNQGTTTDEGYAALADVLFVFEGDAASYASYVPSNWTSKYSPVLFDHLVYNATTEAEMASAVSQATAQRAGYVYVADTGVWFALPSFFNAEMALLRGPGGAIADTGTCTLSVAASGGLAAQSDSSTSVVVIVPASFGDAVTGGSATDSGVVVITIAPGGVEARADSTTLTLVVVPSSSFAEADATTSLVVIAPSGVQAISDAGVCAFSVAPASAGQATVDASPSVLVIAPSGALEALSDATTSLVVLAFSGAVVADAGTCVLTVAPSGSVEAQADATTSTLAILPSSAGEAIADSTTSLAVLVFSGAVVADTGTGVVSIAPSGLDAISDTGTCTLAVTSSGVEAQTDSSACLVVIVPSSFSDALTGGNITDSGAVTLTVATGSAGEALADTSTSVLVVAAAGSVAQADSTTAVVVILPGGGDAQADSSTVVVGIAPTGAEALADTGTALVVLTPSGALTSDTGTLTLGIVPTGVEALLDASTATLVILPGGVAVEVDASTGLIVVTPSGAAAVSDSGTCTFAVTQASAGEATGDSSTLTLVILPTGASTATDSGLATLTVAPGSAGEALTDSTSSALIILPVGADAEADASTSLVVLAFSGNFVIPGGDISDSGTATIIITPSSASIIDSGSFTLAVFPGTLDALGDSSTAILVVAPSSTDAQADSTTSTLIVTPASGLVSLADSSTSLVTILPQSGASSSTDAGAATLTIAAGGQSALADAGTNLLAITPTTTSGVGDASVATFALVFSSTSTALEVGLVTLVILAGGLSSLTGGAVHTNTPTCDDPSGGASSSPRPGFRPRASGSPRAAVQSCPRPGR